MDIPFQTSLCSLYFVYTQLVETVDHKPNMKAHLHEAQNGHTGTRAILCSICIVFRLRPCPSYNCLSRFKSIKSVHSSFSV